MVVSEARRWVVWIYFLFRLVRLWQLIIQSIATRAQTVKNMVLVLSQSIGGKCIGKSLQNIAAKNRMSNIRVPIFPQSVTKSIYAQKRRFFLHKKQAYPQFIAHNRALRVKIILSAIMIRVCLSVRYKQAFCQIKKHSLLRVFFIVI